MENAIRNGKDFRIIPATIENSTTLEILNLENYLLEARLNYLTYEESLSYEIGEEVEVFGSTENGLLYFRAKILSVEDCVIKLAIPSDFTKVQRREYSRIDFDGKMKLISENTEVKALDISAGGVRFVSPKNLAIGKNYDFLITLENNKEIPCKIQPMRTHQNTGIEGFIVSARFSDMTSANKVAIVQYSFRKVMELENSLND